MPHLSFDGYTSRQQQQRSMTKMVRKQLLSAIHPTTTTSTF
jgi:hypothetical protein